MSAPSTPQGIPAGRHTAGYNGEIVVFLIGMRINRFRAIRQWLPVVRAMSPMLRELLTDPQSGLLGMRTLLGWRQIGVVQYWRDIESLVAFAGDPSRSHRPAWLDYFRSAFASGSVGIWHETYVVPAGAAESVYVNLPPAGLGAIQPLVPVGRHGDSFSDRMPSRAA